MIFASTVLRRFMDTKLWFKFLWFLTWLHHPLFRFLCGQAAYNTIWDQFNTPAIIIQIKSRKLKFTKPTTARNVITPSTFLLHTQTSQSVSSLSQSVFLITFLDSDWFPCPWHAPFTCTPTYEFFAPYRAISDRLWNQENFKTMIDIFEALLFISRLCFLCYADVSTVHVYFLEPKRTTHFVVLPRSFHSSIFHVRVWFTIPREWLWFCELRGFSHGKESMLFVG